MPADRYSTLRQRLRREADAFEFGALKEGVSTLQEEPTSRGPQDAPDRAEPEPAPVPVELLPVYTEPKGGPEHASEENGAVAALEPPDEDDTPKVRAAIGAMVERMLLAAAQFEAALRDRSAVLAGRKLAQLNEALELLRSADADAALARRLGLYGAPPEGQGWPAPVWSVAELAASPLSGLLPQDADESFARAVVYAAWGVELE